MPLTTATPLTPTTSPDNIADNNGKGNNTHNDTNNKGSKKGRIHDSISGVRVGIGSNTSLSCSWPLKPQSKMKAKEFWIDGQANRHFDV